MSNLSALPNDPNCSQEPSDSTSTFREKGGLKLRLISAAVGIPVVLLAVFSGVWGIGALVTATALVAGYELAVMARAGKWEGLRYIGASLVPATFGIVVATDESIAAWALVGVGLFSSVSGGIASLSRKSTDYSLIAILFLAAIFFGITLAHAPLLAALDDGRSWLLLAIVGTFAVDTGAYFTGRAIGQHKLAPKISPKKTWEGVGGGVFAAVGVLIVLGEFLNLPVAVWEAMLVGVAITLSGVLGDLFESWIKRRAGVKDSGKLIPGHGGILDRIDSLAPNLAVVYWATQLIGN